MRKEKSRDAARSRRSKENHEFYELAKLLPLPAAITSQLDFLDKASIIRLTISFLKLRQFSVNGHPPWAPDFTTLGSINPYSTHSLVSADSANATPTLSSHNAIAASPATPQQIEPHNNALALATDPTPLMPSLSFAHQNNNNAAANSRTQSLFEVHQGTHILQSLDGFAFAIGRDGRFLYISETVSMYLGLSQVEMTGSSVFDYTHSQDHEELAKQLGIAFTPLTSSSSAMNCSALDTSSNTSPPPTSVHSQYSAASNETMIDEHVNNSAARKHQALNNKRTPLGRQPATAAAASAAAGAGRGAYGRQTKRQQQQKIKAEQISITNSNDGPVVSANSVVEDDTKLCNKSHATLDGTALGTGEDPLVRQFCIRMKSTLTKRGCQHFKSSGYRVVHVIAHLRSYQSNDHGHLMDPLDEQPGSDAMQHIAGAAGCSKSAANSNKRRKLSANSKTEPKDPQANDASSDNNVISHRNAQDQSSATQKQQKIIGMVAIAIALPPPSINEMRLECDTFVLRLSLDLRVTHIEPKITEVLHYPVDMIAGASLYSLVHPADVHHVHKCHRELLKKGQMMSCYYRLLARTGGYIWIQTCATLISNTNMSAGPSAAAIAAAAAVAAASASATPMGNSMAPNSSSPVALLNNNYGNLQSQQHQQHQQHFGAPLLMSPFSANEYASTNASPAHMHKSIASDSSPGFNSSHLASAMPAGYDMHHGQLDQDQCLIFVNYMITNVVDSEHIIDVCQSEDYSPPVPPPVPTQQQQQQQHMATQLSGNSNLACNLAGNQSFHSANLIATPPGGFASRSSGFLAPIEQVSTTIAPKSNIVMSNSNKRLQSDSDKKHSRAKHSNQSKSTGKSSAYRLAADSEPLARDENLANGSHHLDSYATHTNSSKLLQDAAHHYDALSASGDAVLGTVYNYAAAVAASQLPELALNHHHTHHTHHNQQQQQQQQHNQAHHHGSKSQDSQQVHDNWYNQQQQADNTSYSHHPVSSAAAAASDYATGGAINRIASDTSIYKAAFGLDGGDSVYSAYQAGSGSGSANYSSSTNNSARVWDATGSATSAAASLTAQQQQQQHTQAQATHHHNDYLTVAAAAAAQHHVALDHHQAAAAAAAAAAAQHHHHHHAPHHHHHHHNAATATSAATSAAGYYNYYGYYGNKFI